MRYLEIGSMALHYDDGINDNEFQRSFVCFWSGISCYKAPSNVLSIVANNE